MSVNSKKIFIAIVASGSGVAGAAAPDFTQGEWNLNYRMEVVGMSFPMPPITSKKTLCITKENLVPDMAQEGQVCTASDQKVNGNTVTWTVNCQAKEGKVEGQGKITYAGGRADGVVNASLIPSANPDMPIRYQYTIEGKLVGNCPK